MNYVEPHKILLKCEIQTVLAQYPGDSIRNLTNRVIFRLSCCCGLRRKEICGLNVGDVHVEGDRPLIFVSKHITKGQEKYRKSRRVPLWWDRGTFRDIRDFSLLRRQQGATDSCPFVVKTRRDFAGERMTEPRLARRWSTAIKVLGPARVRQLSVHTGRHTFCSHSLQAGRSLVQIQHAAGHATTRMTERYLHLLDDDDVRDVFGGDDE